MQLEGVWLGGSTLIMLVYFALVLAVWAGPYGFVALVLVWLWGLAAVPILGFGVGAFEVHRILVKVKREQVELANKRVNTLAYALEKDSGSASLEDLDFAMSVQARLQAMREWPFSISELVAFLVALIPVAIQVTLVVRNIDGGS